MLIRDVLGAKGTDVVTVDPQLSVLEAARVLVQHNIGSVVVLEAGTIVGILTERDVLRQAAAAPERLATTPVADAMTADLVIGVPDDSVSEAKSVMTQRRVRHLPIMDGGQLAGLVSIGDLVNASLNDLKSENRWLRDYVQGNT